MCDDRSWPARRSRRHSGLPHPGLVWAGLALLLLCSCKTPPLPPADLARFEFSQPQMGVPFRVVLYATNALTAERVAQAAFDRIRQLNDLLSDYESESELSRLSRTSGHGTPVPVSPDLWRVLEHGQGVARRSRGAFDMTVGPSVQQWRRARRQHRLPDPAQLAEAQQAIGFEKLQLDARRQTATLLAPKMRLDLGGIAKGYAADEALKVLRQNGLPRALVAGSGDIAVGQPPPGKPGWRIEIAPLDVTNAPPAKFVLIKNCGLATSGDLFQYLEIDGRRYSHIVDPRTGIGLTTRSLVTVIAEDGMTADALATAVSVMGPSGMKLIEATPGAAAHLVWQAPDRIDSVDSRRMRGRYEPAGAPPKP